MWHLIAVLNYRSSLDYRSCRRSARSRWNCIERLLDWFRQHTDGRRRLQCRQQFLVHNIAREDSRARILIAADGGEYLIATSVRISTLMNAG